LRSRISPACCEATRFLQNRRHRRRALI
jgi:hypothetical protein